MHSLTFFTVGWAIAVHTAKDCARAASAAVGGGQISEAAVSAEKADQAALLREIIGNPFHSASLNESWMLWNNGTVRKLAKAMYVERRFADLPLMADALEEAGCDNEDILAHCRSRDEHVRGCWVLDLLLGKQ